MNILLINPGWELEPLISCLRSSSDTQLFSITFPWSKFTPTNAFLANALLSPFDVTGALDFALKHSIQAVLADQCDFALFTQSMLTTALGLPGPSSASAYLSNNKYLQRELCKSKGIVIPNYKLCLSVEDVEAFASRVGYPIILKPVDNRGSIGVNKVHSISELTPAFLHAVSSSRSQLVLAEEFIDGIQFSVDSYVPPNRSPISLAIGQKLMASNDLQVAMGISYPANLPEHQYDQLLTLNQNVNHLLGYDFGLVHSEYMLRNETFYLIESSNRGGGCLTSQIVVPFASGFDLLSHYIQDCCGFAHNDVLSISFERNPVSLRFFTVPANKYPRICNWDEITNNPVCLYGRLIVHPNTKVSPVTSDADRHGFLIVKGSDRDAEALISCFEYTHD